MTISLTALLLIAGLGVVPMHAVPGGRGAELNPSTNLVASNTLRWVKVRASGGEIKVKLDPNLRTPVVNGSARTRAVGNDLEIVPQSGGGAMGIGIVVPEVGEMEVRVPRGWGLELDTQSGTIEAERIPFVKGRVGTGEVVLKSVEGIDLTMNSGELQGSLLLRNGQHRVRVATGEVNLRLLPGSSVRLSPTVKAGNLSTPGFRRVGSALQLGDGRASLTATVDTGDLKVGDR